MRKRAYLFAREMVWKRVAQGYMTSFARVRSDRMKSPQVQFSARAAQKALDHLPEVKLNHLHRLTDDTGILQHAIFTVPNYREGYTTDDNARALILTVLLNHPSEAQLSKSGYARADSAIPQVATPESTFRYLSFLSTAFDSEKCRFKNFLDYDRQWAGRSRGLG
jgi:hypothetical protein